jgi:hypothetical protein
VHSELFAEWQRLNYPPSVNDTLVRILTQFDILFPIDNRALAALGQSNASNVGVGWPVSLGFASS